MRIALLNWRDTANPEGGGSEVYIEEIAQRLVQRGHQVTLVCAAHAFAPALEVRAGVRIVRRGSKLTVYREARRLLRSGALGPLDVVVDTQNGIPFLTPWATRVPVVVLVHHVHREQWPVVYDPVRARIGWWVESQLAPHVYRRCPYVAVSGATAAELAQLGITPDRIHVVYNGIAPTPVRESVPREPHPRILVLGRLVPHKRVEHVLHAARHLRARHPGLRVAIVGDGWWGDELKEIARALGVSDIVDFTGHVDEEEKAKHIDSAWVLALPSLKEGWGLVVLEAARQRVPSVAYRAAGGVSESIVDRETGLLVDGGFHEFARALDEILTNADFRRQLGTAAQTYAESFSWDASVERFESILQRAIERLASSSSRRRRTVRRR